MADDWQPVPRAEPTAVAAYYDAHLDRVVVRLRGGLQVAFPPSAAPGLETATAADLAKIEISPSGLGIHFPRVDADLYVPGLVKDFGSA